MSVNHILKTSISGVALLLLGSATALGGTVSLGIFLNTSSLEGLGQFSLAFQLEDGSGTGDANNSVTLNNFQFYGGSTGLVADGLFGGASGSLSSGVTLIDSDPFFNALVQRFTPGAGVSFVATLSNNADAGPFQDMFAMSLLDGSGNGIPTVDPSGNDTMLTIMLGGLAPSVGVWGTDTSLTSYDVPAPQVVPEPGSLMLLGSALAGLGLRRLRRRH